MITAPADFVYGLADKRLSPNKFGSLPDILSFNGFYDDNIQIDAQKKFIRASMPDLGNQDINGLSENNRFLPTIKAYGGDVLSLPVQANMSDGRTNIEIRMPQDANKSGHYVFFQYPQLKYQAQCFLSDILKGETPTVRDTDGKLGDSCN